MVKRVKWTSNRYVHMVAKMPPHRPQRHSMTQQIPTQSDMSHGIILRIQPAHLPAPVPQPTSPSMQGRKDRHTDEEGQDPLRRKREREAVLRLPGGDEERIRECGQVQEDAVEGDDAHALQRVGIHHIACHHRVAHLDPRCKQEEGDLADDPMVCFIDADAPDDQTDGAEDRGGVSQPQSHLGDAHPVVAGGEFDEDGIREAAGAECLAEQGAEQKADEEEALDLRGVGDVGGRKHGYDGEDPPVPGEAVHQDRNDHDRVFEGEHEAGE